MSAEPGAVAVELGALPRVGRRPGALVVYRWELRKLRSQKRTYLGLAAAVIMPLAFVIALAAQGGQPNDVPFGRYVRESGLAIPLVMLVFGSGFIFPLIPALVAGDIFAAEDHNGTLKTILTRSVDRGHVFAGKALAAMTYTLAALVLMGVVAIGAGCLESGFHALTSLSGTRVASGHALGLVCASIGVFLLPLLSLTCIGLLLSTTTRNSAAAVVGTVMVIVAFDLLGIIPGLGALKPYLLPSQFDAWMGFLRVPTDWAPIARAAWVSAGYALPCLLAAYLVFVRRDVAGG